MRRLVKWEQGVFTLLAENRVSYVPGEPYRVDVLVYGSTLEVRVNRQVILGGAVTDTGLTKGSVALYSWLNNGSMYDDVRVTEFTMTSDP